MINKKWQSMQNLEDSFNQIVTFDFMIKQLEKSVSRNDMDAIKKITDAMISFYPIYCENWDDKFSTAWDELIGSVDKPA